MHDLDKAIRAAMMTAHRYARGGYAGGGGAESVLMQERDESTYGPTNLEERKARIQEMTTPTNYPGDKLEAPMGYMTPATAVEWKSGDAGPYAVDASGNTLPLIPQPGMLPMYRDPTIDSIRPAMPGVIDLVGNVVGAPLGMTARRVIQAGMTGERPAANVLNIFGGEKAQTADLAALDTAKKMAETGAKREDIIDKTGWFQGADKKWRFEIPDNTSYADVESLAGEGVKLGSKLPLNNVFSHNPLYKAYPETATTDVRLMRSTDPFAVSSGEKYPLFVSLPEGSSDKLARAKLIHEAQHLVQRQEGFAEGANPKMFQHDKVSGLTPYEQYRRSIGEIEARNVERRRYMTPEERQRVYPWATEDVPIEQQIIHSSSAPKTEPQMSVGPSPMEAAQEMANKAVQTYGTTHNIAEAGYVLPNGKMLDFSGRHQAGYNRVGDKFAPKQGERDWLANDRAVDHRDVVHMLASPEGMEGHEGMAKFMAEAGAIRNKPGIGFEAAAIPTDKQIKTIVTSHNTKYRGEPMLVELSHPTTGDIIASRDFERPNVEAIQKWFGEQSKANPGIQLAPKFSRGGKASRAFSSTPFGPEAAQRAVQIAKQQAGRR